jgi:aspartate carbamoyltransferase regulatory subunit
VLSWISGDELTNLTDIINIASAYLARRDYVKLPLRFLELVEISVLKLSS